MGSSLDTQLVAFNINTEPTVPELNDDIINTDEFHEIVNNAKEIDIESLDLSPEEKTELKNKIEQFAKVQNKANEEQLDKILRNTDIQKDLSLIASIKTKQDQNKVEQKNNEINQQIINTSKDTFIAAGELTGQKDSNDPQYWEQLSTGKLQLDEQNDLQRSDQKLQATEDTINRFQNDPTNPQNIAKVEEVSTTLNNAQANLEKANEEQRMILENNNLNPEEKDQLESLEVSASERIKKGSELRNEFNKVVIDTNKPAIEELRRLSEDPNISEEERQDIRDAIEAYENGDGDPVTQVIIDRLKAQGKSDEEIAAYMEKAVSDYKKDGKVSQDQAELIRESLFLSDSRFTEAIKHIDDSTFTELTGQNRTEFVTNNREYIRANQLLKTETLTRFDQKDPNYRNSEVITARETQARKFSNKLDEVLEPGSTKDRETYTLSSNLVIPPFKANEISAKYGIDRNNIGLINAIALGDVNEINARTQNRPELQAKLNKEIQGNFLLPEQDRINNRQNLFFGLSIS
ncbi:MAG: hypothetical protein HRT47_11385 [Candidatus Caenarcaniphilales bacterium]|nr:hypothetical protein [Candidatus Caenarcaniphilales bacterium]